MLFEYKTLIGMKFAFYLILNLNVSMFYMNPTSLTIFFYFDTFIIDLQNRNL